MRMFLPKAYVCQDIIDRFTGVSKSRPKNRWISMRCLKSLHTIYGSKLETLQRLLRF